MTPEERALESAWKICSAWDGKITKPVLRKVIAAYLKEIEAEDELSYQCDACSTPGYGPDAACHCSPPPVQETTP